MPHIMASNLPGENTDELSVEMAGKLKLSDARDEN